MTVPTDEDVDGRVPAIPIISRESVMVTVVT
jgi:hypothetical protein